jgi:hypothetical protein
MRSGSGCGERGWVALTRDGNIRRRALERRAIRESGAAVFVRARLRFK